MATVRPIAANPQGELPAGFRHQGVRYDLAHLRSYTTKFTRPSTAKTPQEVFTVNVSFSHHCFTRGLPEDGSTWDTTLQFAHSNEVRLFDARRWHLSKHLPYIIASLPTNKCLRTSHGNFFSISLVAEDGSTVEYEVFFRTWKPGRGRVFLHVESAYVRDNPATRPKATAVGFFVILHNTLHGKPIHG